MNKKPFVSVCVPTHDMEGKHYFFKRLMDSLWNQSFQDFEIVVTDNSEDDEIGRMCEFYKTGIRYFKNPKKGMAQNTNEAMRNAKGNLIKILYMDDFMAHDQALERIVEKFKGHWLVTGCMHTTDGERFYGTHFASYNDQIQTGNNTIGSPSVLTILNKDLIFFDEKMTWLLDCDLYKRYHDKYGDPVIVEDLNVVIGVHEGQATFTMGDDRKSQEHEYMNNKYANA